MAAGRKRVSGARGNGTLFIIGGHENKTGPGVILKEIAKRAAKGRLLVLPIASELPDEVFKDYQTCFKSLGVKKIERIDLLDPSDSRHLDLDKLFHGTSVLFFPGGAQLKITTKIAGSPFMDRLLEFFDEGGTIAGTSAGAAALGNVMFTGGHSDKSTKVGAWQMAPALGLHENILIDNHFAERGRLGRLMSAVALNPGMLGMGIDENTAVVVHKNNLEVIGENGVYMVCGMDITYTNAALAPNDHTLSVHDLKVHILAPGEKYDLSKRRPVPASDFKLPEPGAEVATDCG